MRAAASPLTGRFLSVLSGAERAERGAERAERGAERAKQAERC
jgi:hypothetical protein